jgi:hypothetical protein
MCVHRGNTPEAVRLKGGDEYETAAQRADLLPQYLSCVLPWARGVSGLLVLPV